MLIGAALSFTGERLTSENCQGEALPTLLSPKLLKSGQRTRKQENVKTKKEEQPFHGFDLGPNSSLV